MKKLLLILLSALPLVSCHSLPDPYEHIGINGIRMNINGDKYILQSNYYVRYDNDYHFVLSGTATNTAAYKEDQYKFTLDINDSGPFAAGKKVDIPTGAAKLLYGEGYTSSVSLSGWLKVTDYNEQSHMLEAYFELESPSHQVKHGFLRIKL